MKTIHVKKGQVIQVPGEVQTKAYYVELGLLRSYVIDQKGREYIFMFAPEGWLIADSSPPEVPGELFIDALEDSTLKVFEKGTEHNNDDRPKLIKRLGVLQKRVIQLMSASAIERYEHFIDTYPNITQRVPQRMIASYLGITPEALSKVKGEKARGK